MDVLKAARQRVREEVTAVYDAMQSEPDRGIPAKDAFAEVRARHAMRETPRDRRECSNPETT